MKASITRPSRTFPDSSFLTSPTAPRLHGQRQSIPQQPTPQKPSNHSRPCPTTQSPLKGEDVSTHSRRAALCPSHTNPSRNQSQQCLSEANGAWRVKVAMPPGAPQLAPRLHPRHARAPREIHGPQPVSHAPAAARGQIHARRRARSRQPRDGMEAPQNPRRAWLAGESERVARQRRVEQLQERHVRVEPGSCGCDGRERRDREDRGAVVGGEGG
jgi:hypothetical protein